MPCRVTQAGQVIEKNLTKCSPLEKKMATHSCILAAGTSQTVWKGKKIHHQKMSPLVRRIQYFWSEVLEKSGGQLLIAPERMKWLGQSGKDTQLWMSLLVKVKSSGVRLLLHQFSAVDQSCPTLCDPMNHSMPGLPVHHKLPEFTQTHVHRFGDATQPSHPLSSPSPPATNPSQHQSLFQWVSSSHEVAKVLEFQL